jgi:acyl transferase domain-containing protein
MTETQEAMPIAILGMGCRLPGGASNSEKLWDLLVRKQCARKEAPPERFNIDAFYHPDGDNNGTINNRAGHYIKEYISALDAPFFSISPDETLSMDPMQRFFLLEVVCEAMESAGVPASSLTYLN